MASSTRGRARSSSLAALLSLIVVLAGACATGGAGIELPEATLGTTSDAEEIFRPLMRSWALGTGAERQALDGRLTAFNQRFEGDSLVRLGLVLRAFNALDRGDLEIAMDLATGEKRPALESPLFGPAGTTRDLAQVVAGSVERRRGRPHQALARLRPLLHKMLDDFATNILNEELVQAALGAHAWADAVQFLEVWRLEAAPGSERYVDQRVSELLAQVPKEELLDALASRSQDRQFEGSLAREIAQQLALVVVNSHDIALARELVERYKALLGSYGEAVARLAMDSTRGKVSARTVGVLLSLRNSAMKRRSVDVTKGVAFGLRSRGSDARLVSRDATAEPEDVIRAMSELAGEGAALIIAGLDPLQSEAAATYAADNTLPVLLLTPDRADLGSVSPFVFTIGNDPSDTTGRLAAALHAAGAKVVAGFGASLSASDTAAGVGVLRPCDGSANAADMKAEGVDAILALDGCSCGPELIQTAEAIRARFGVGLGVSALDPAPANALVLAAGVFPVGRGAADPRLAAWIGEGRPPPSWWTALARDAAMLAYEAVENLEETGADDASGVRARRQQAAVGLAGARATLWTTDVRGFSTSQRMPRTIRVLGKGGDEGR